MFFLFELWVFPFRRSGLSDRIRFHPIQEADGETEQKDAEPDDEKSGTTPVATGVLVH